MAVEAENHNGHRVQRVDVKVEQRHACTRGGRGEVHIGSGGCCQQDTLVTTTTAASADATCTLSLDSSEFASPSMPASAVGGPTFQVVRLPLHGHLGALVQHDARGVHKAQHSKHADKGQVAQPPAWRDKAMLLDDSVFFFSSKV